MSELLSIEHQLPAPPERATMGRYGSALWQYKGELHEWPIIATRYAKDLLAMAAETIEQWPYTDSEQDKALVAEIRRFVA